MSIEQDRNVAIFGDMNMNIIDGSSVWVQSIVRSFALVNNVVVHLFLKAPIERRLLIEELGHLDNVKIIVPPNKNPLDHDSFIEALERADTEIRFDAILLRGLRVSLAVARHKSFKNRLWLYLTDIPQSPRAMTPDSITTLETLGEASRYVLCQTEDLRSFLEAWVPNVRGKCILLPPMIPTSSSPIAPKTHPGRVLFKLVYSGKFAPGWNTIEMVRALDSIELTQEKLEFHIIGDKFHNPKGTDFAKDMRAVLENGERVNWHGGMARQEALRLVESCHLGNSWRGGDLDASLELSTKVLEYGSQGLPVLLNRTIMHEELLGADYPLFIDRLQSFEQAVLKAIHEPDSYNEAAIRCSKATEQFTFEQTAEHLNKALETGSPAALRPGSGTKKLRILVASHDWKFINKNIEYLSSLRSVELRRDFWTGIENHDESESKRLLEWADIVLCEWCCGAAVWYSKNISRGKRLVIRFHRFEVETIFPAKVDFKNVEKVIFVNQFYADCASEKFGWNTEKCTVVPNWVDVSQLDRPKLPGSEFNIGIMGITPRLKRLDLAVELISQLRSVDSRYTLYVKSKLPVEYPWIWRKAEESSFYIDTFRKINSDPFVKAGVVVDPFGADVPLWFRKIGFILSVSDIESFHLAAAEGMASGSLPLCLRWQGVEQVFPEKYIFSGISSMVKAILEYGRRGLSSDSLECRKYIADRYRLEDINKTLARELGAD